MLKSLIYAVKCDQYGKLMSLKNCIKCEFYLGKKSDRIECMFDKEKYNKEIEKQYKEYYGVIEFGEENE